MATRFCNGGPIVAPEAECAELCQHMVDARQWVMFLHILAHSNNSVLSVFARIERGQGADLGKGHFCARPIILRALLRVILHFEGTIRK